MSNRHTNPAELRTVADVLQRRCAGCERWLAYDRSNFYRNRANHSQLTNRCQTCLKAGQTASRHACRVPRIGPRNAQGDEPVVWARYAVRNARRARKWAE